MKWNYFLAAGLAAAIGIGVLPARTWTNADGTRTFEGEFKAYDKEGGKVTVIMRNGRAVTFDIAKLSDVDQTFLQEQAKNDPAGGADDRARSEVLPPQGRAGAVGRLPARGDLRADL